MYIKQLKHPTPSNIKDYKSYRNRLNRLQKLAERKHYMELLNLHKSDLKKTWNVIKDVINKSKKRKSNKVTFTINNKPVEDEGIISDSFNEFFTNKVLITIRL